MCASDDHAYLVLYGNALIAKEAGIQKIAGSNCQAVVCATGVGSSHSTIVDYEGKDLLHVAEWLLA